ncbi:MAG: SurA N-terminal domain-containing protein, partial [Brevinematales bacterium]
MGVIAEINGEQITMEMLDSAVGRYIVQLEEDEEADFKPTKENMKFIKTEVLNFLMERKLLLKRAMEEGFLA